MKKRWSRIVAASALLAMTCTTGTAHSADTIATIRSGVVTRTIKRGSPAYQQLLAFIAKHNRGPGATTPDAQDLGDFSIGYTHTRRLPLAQAATHSPSPPPPYSPAAIGQYGADDTFHAATCLDGVRQRWNFRFEAATGWVLHDYAFRRLPAGICAPSSAASGR